MIVISNQVKIKHKNPSINFLEERCESALRQKVNSSYIWCPDSWNTYPENIGNQVVDVVLFGSFFERFLEFAHWPLQNIRLWVLCKRSKKNMIELLGLPADSIGVIKRDWLISRGEPIIPDYQMPFEMIYAGRISESKNIEMLLHVASLLQIQHGKKFSLSLLGDFDQETHLCSGEYNSHLFKERVFKLIENLKWNQPPKIVNGLNSSEWLKLDYVRPVLISLSTQIYEDFGVSLAQAQNLGWPAILSDWGGHADASSENTIFLNSSLIGKKFDSEADLLAVASLVASEINTKMSMTTKAPPPVEREDVIPEILALENLRKLVQRYIEKNGSSMLWAFRKNFATYASSENGKSFFSHYRRIYSGADKSEFDIYFFESYPALNSYFFHNKLKPNDYLINIDKLSLKTLSSLAISSKKIFFIGDSEKLLGLKTFLHHKLKLS